MKTILNLSILFLFATEISSCAKSGCTNPEAINYDSKATKDDGTCVVDFTEKVVGMYKGLLVDDDGTTEYPHPDQYILVSKVDNSHVNVAPINGGIADPFTASIQKLPNGNYSLTISGQTNSSGNTISGYNITVSGNTVNGAYEPSTTILRYGITISNLGFIEAFQGTKL